MGRRSKASALDVWMNGALVGTWKVTPSRGHEFTYDEAWTNNPNACPISLSLSLRPYEPYRGELVSNFFENLLPDNKAIRDRLRERFGAPTSHAFDLLNEIGRDCVGAIQLLPKGETPRGNDRIDSIALDEGEVAKRLRQTLATGYRHGDGDDDDFRISLAGTQEKTALLRHEGGWRKPRGATPTTHILKMPLGIAPSGIDLSTSIENEWLCTQLLRAFDIEATRCEIARFEDLKVLVVERFDRRLSERGDWIVRLPQEDFAQVTGNPPDRKYESDGGPGIARIMDHLMGAEEPERDRVRFMRTQLVFWLLCAIDGHAKNFSVFIERQGRFRLTPSYDVLSAYPVLGKAARKISPEKARMAMAVWGKNRHYRWAEIRKPHFVQTARECGLGRLAETMVDEIVEAAPQAVEKVRSALPSDFPSSVADPILAGVAEAARKLAH